MSVEPEKIDLETPDLAAPKRAAFEDLFPGVLADGVLDAARLGELLDTEVAAPADGRERFGLMWAGKHDAVRALLTPSRGTLVPDVDNSLAFDTAKNVLIEGDNLEVLKLLQKAYNDKVKLIYIDPPYNTGNDFVYNDDFTDGLTAYLGYSGQADDEGNRLSAAVEGGGRRHSRWLSMIYPRLVLARNLLTQDGVIMISIDENEVAHLKLALDEVFGAENFVAQLTVLNNPKGRSQDKFFATNHEYVVIYSRATRTSGSFSVAKSQEQILADYPLDDEHGRFRLLELRNTHREFGRHNRPNLYYPIYVLDDGSVSLSGGGVEVLPLWPDGYEGCWTWGVDKASDDIALLVGRSVNGQFKIYRKDYARGARRMLKTILADKRYTTEAGQREFNEILNVKGKVFQSPKSPHLLADLMATATGDDDLILDFFAGSGSSAHATSLLNASDGARRTIISVNLPEPTGVGSDAFKNGYSTVSEITLARLRAVAESIDGAAGLGLRVFSLRESHFRENAKGASGDLFDLSPTTLLDSTQDAEAIAAEVLLKEGVPLNARWINREASDTPVIQAEGVAVVLTREITDRVVAEALALGPRVVVFLEDGFVGADAVKANAVTNARNLGITLKTV